MHSKYRGSKVILAADELSLDKCLELVSKIGPQLYAIKIHNIYDQYGPGVVKRLLGAGANHIWVDAKLHDIPNTVGLRAKAIKDSGANILTVHASGELEMMWAALQNGPEQIFAITVLTSLDEEEVHLLHGHSSKATVLYLARLAKLAGCTGVVCSPKEVGILAKRHELVGGLKGLKLVVPGVRSVGQSAGDQQRVDTPANAIKAGANYLVVGRQLTETKDPIETLKKLEEEISEALVKREKN